MAGDKVTITVKGGAPWGFRLFGGESLPLTIARLRRKSKAQECGLQEGDTLLTINGYSCKDMSHATAMTLVDSSGQSLTMTVLRGNPDKYAVDAAFQTLGPSKVVPAHMLQVQPRSKTYSPNAELDLQDSNYVQMNGELNGPLDDTQRTQQTFYDGDTTRHVTTETSKQQFGSTTLTKTSREEVTTSGGGWQSPMTQRRIEQVQHTEGPSTGAPSKFSVSKYASNVYQKPGVWTPSGAATHQSQQPIGISVSAPEGVTVQHHPDQSVTMTIGLASPKQPDYSTERNVPSFNVSNVAKVTNQPKGIWAPGIGAPELRRPSPQPELVVPPPSVPRAPSPSPEPELHFYDAFDHFDPSARDSPITRIPINPPLIEPLHLSELIKGESFSDDDYLDSPTRKSFYNKKIYSDSSFYDDPEAKYPTIEEQIKMARKVALSLMAPANKTARGHKMFMKRVHKSSRWVAGEGPDGNIQLYIEDTDEPDEVYYQPNPWKGDHTWQPTKPVAPLPPPKPTFQAMSPSQLSPLAPTSLPLQHQAPAITPSYKLSSNPAYKPAIPKPFKLSTADNLSAVEEPTPAPQFKPSTDFVDDIPFPPAPPPPPPPVPTLSMWGPPVPSRPKYLYDDDKENSDKRILSPNDVERQRLYGKKSMHNMVSPQVCFSLSDDLRNMKGKGGKLFAKRRARSEKWVVEEKPNLSTPNRDMMAKLLSQATRDVSISSPESPVRDIVDFTAPSGGGAPRLQQMLAASKGACSPWEAAVTSGTGDVEKAFEHLNRYHTLPMRGRKAGGTHPFAGIASDLTGTQFTSSNPSAADAAPAYVTATTYVKGRPQASPSSKTAHHAAALPTNNPATKLPDYTHKIQPWGNTPLGPGAVTTDVNDWSEPQSHPVVPSSSYSPAARTSSHKPSGPDPNYNTKVKPWRSSGNFDSVDYSNYGIPSMSSSVSSGTSSGAGFRPVQFKSPSASIGMFGGAPTMNMSIPVGGNTEGFSDL